MTFQITDLKDELVVFVRNQNIFPISLRGVTTANDTGTFTSESDYTISLSNVKNIRSIEIDSNPLSFGEDYTVDYSFGPAGSQTCKITFTSPQTGSYDIEYDYGPDKIWGDFPRDDLKIHSYPRIAIDVMSTTTDAFGVGGDLFISDVAVTIVVYADNPDSADNYINAIRNIMITNSKEFFHTPFIKPILVGPLINSPDRSNTILHRNVDFMAMFNIN